MKEKTTFELIRSWIAKPAEFIQKIITSPKTKSFLIQISEGSKRFAEAQRERGILEQTPAKNNIPTTASSKYKKTYVR